MQVVLRANVPRESYRSVVSQGLPTASRAPQPSAASTATASASTTIHRPPLSSLARPVS